MTLLSIVRSACDRIGLQRPNSVISGSDQTARTLMAFANEEGETLASLYPWQQLRKETSFLTVAQEEQTASVPSDFLRFIDGTFWNRTTMRQLLGPISPAAWQEMRARSASPVVDAFMTRAGLIHIIPTPAAGQSIFYEYQSAKWVMSEGSYYTEFQTDSDTAVVPEKLITLGLVWRFKQSKGLSFEVEYSKYEFAIRQAMSDDQPSDIIELGGYTRMRQPGVSVPEGNWSP